MLLFYKIIIAITFIILIITYRKDKNYKIKMPILFIVGLAFCVDDIIIPLTKGTQIPKNLIYNLYSLIDIGVWFYVVFTILKNQIPRYIAVFLTLIVYTSSFIELFFYDNINQFHTTSFCLYELILILISIYYLYFNLKIDYYSFSDNIHFWIIAACIIYHSISFLKFTFMGLYSSSKNIQSAAFGFYLLGLLSNLLFCIFICIAFMNDYFNKLWKTI